MDIRCQCGTIAFKTSTPEPLESYICHCTECRAQSASAFGTSVIFPAKSIFPLAPELAANLSIYSRPGTGKTIVQCYFCKVCGVRVMGRDRYEDGSEQETVCIKGGCVQGLDWKKAVDVQIFCRSAVVSIPDGSQKWEELDE